MKFILKLFVVSLVVSLFVWIINLIVSGWHGIEQAIIDLGIDLLFSFILTLLNTYYFNFIGKFYSWSKNGVKRLLVGALGSVVVTVITLAVLLFITRVYIYGVSIEQFFNTSWLSWFLFCIAITVIISIAFHAFYFWKELQKQKVQQHKVIASSATAQFDALKNQLDPHFLFNSLNVLVSLIEENPKAATKFTTSLSKVYRYVLEQRNKELVSVDEELQFARTYIRLLQWRFEDSLKISIPDQASDPSLQVVPLSLQLVLENAVKHNIVSDSKPLELSIYEQDAQLIIKNNLQPKENLAKGSGVGLQNIASRYALLSNRSVNVQQDQHYFTVSIPTLSKQDLNTISKINTMDNIEDIRLTKAKERVADIKEFYDNLLRMGAILTFLALMNYFTSNFPWVIFPAIGMSIGVFFQYLKTFNSTLPLGKNWEERKIEELMNDKNF